MVLSATPMVATSRSRNVRCRPEKVATDANSITPSISPSNSTGSTTRSLGGIDMRPERMVRMPSWAARTRTVRRETAA
jgi:hypothetical protein